MTHWTVSHEARAKSDTIKADATRLASALGSPAATFESVAAARALIDKMLADLPKLALELEFAPQLV